WLLKLMKEMPQWLQRFRDAQGSRPRTSEYPQTTAMDQPTEAKGEPIAGPPARQETVAAPFADAPSEDQDLPIEEMQSRSFEPILAPSAGEDPDQRGWDWVVGLVFLTSLEYADEARPAVWRLQRIRAKR